MLDGKNFFEIQEMVKNDDRFSFGCLDGSEGEGRIDLNYKGVLITRQYVKFSIITKNMMSMVII